jgi:hypothetical protein
MYCIIKNKVFATIGMYYVYHVDGLHPAVVELMAGVKNEDMCKCVAYCCHIKEM